MNLIFEYECKRNETKIIASTVRPTNLLKWLISGGPILLIFIFCSVKEKNIALSSTYIAQHNISHTIVAECCKGFMLQPVYAHVQHKFI